MQHAERASDCAIVGSVNVENLVTGEGDYLTDTCQEHRARYRESIQQVITIYSKTQAQVIRTINRPDNQITIKDSQAFGVFLIHMIPKNEPLVLHSHYQPHEVCKLTIRLCLKQSL